MQKKSGEGLAQKGIDTAKKIENAPNNIANKLESATNKVEKYTDKVDKATEAIDPNNIDDTIKKGKELVSNKKNETIDKIKEVPQKIKEAAQKTKKTIKNAPKKTKELALKGKKQVGEAYKKGRETAQYIRKNPGQAAKKAGKEVGNLAKKRGKNFLNNINPVNKAKNQINNIKRSVKTAKRLARVAKKAAKSTAKLMKNVGKVIAKIGAKIIEFLVSNPVGWAIDILLVLALIIILILSLDEDDGSSSLAGNMTQATGTSWEQFLRFVEKNEGGTVIDGYYIVEDDSWGNPTIGHGLCLYSNGSYLNVEAFQKHGIDSKKLADDWLNNGTQGKVSKEICDSIWSDGLKARYENIKSTYSNLGLKEYQIYSLIDVKYRRGYTNGFEDQYNSLWSSSDDKYGESTSGEQYSMTTLYSFFNNGFSDTASGVYTRKKRQWLLFKYGYYESLGEYYKESNYDSSFYGGINIYNSDGSVNADKMDELDDYLTHTCLNTEHHYQNYYMQQGPFFKWWTNIGLQNFQCTWWANGRASQYLEQNGSKYTKYPTIHGHGGQYYNENLSGGWFNYGQTPKQNSVISWSYGDYGHVAYVEAVDSVTDDVWISHAGGGWSWFGIKKLTKSSGYSPYSGAVLNGFIYLDEPK